MTNEYIETLKKECPKAIKQFHEDFDIKHEEYSSICGLCHLEDWFKDNGIDASFEENWTQYPDDIYYWKLLEGKL